jgi:tetratricopeptide (TPR) repeat protein
MDIYAQTQFNLGIIYQKLGSYEKAIEHWKQVPKTKSALYANAIFNIGIVYREQGDFEKAIEFGDKYLTMKFRLMPKPNLI